MLMWYTVSILICFIAQIPYASTYDATIEEPSKVNLKVDAQRLYDAMWGWGTDEDVLVEILTHRNYTNRMELVKVYNDEHHENLRDDIEDETSSYFEHALTGLVLPQARFLAEEMDYAMRGWGTYEDVLTHVLMLTINEYDTVQDMKYYYKIVDDDSRSLEEAIDYETDSHFEEFLVSVLNRPKFDESAGINESSINIDLSNIKKFISAKEISSIISLVTRRSLKYLDALQDRYFQDQQHKLQDDLYSITGGDVGDGLKALMVVASDYHGYCASELYAAMKGLGTDEYALTRIIVTRADKDLQLIKNKYNDMYGKQLSEAVRGETSGYYRDTLLSLIN